MSWDYPIPNASDFAWNIDKVHVVCRCTVPSVSSARIAPGKQETVTVQLDCGDDVADIVKAVTVGFKESDAAPVRLLIKASVRAPMTPSLREASFGGVAPGDSPEQAITLSNYSDADWTDLRVEDLPPWAEVAILPHRAGRGRAGQANGNAPRQIWRATVKLTGQDLAAGYHQEPVVFRADTGDECRVHLAARLEPFVRIVPEKLVFGPAAPGESCVRVSRVILQKRAGVARVESRVEADSLSVEARQLNESIWELKATMIVPPDGQPADGEIRVSFPGAPLADAALPYSFYDLSTAR